jgi:hypothetical protein
MKSLYLVEKAGPAGPLPHVRLFEATTPCPPVDAYGSEWLVVPADFPDAEAAVAEAYFAGQLPEQAAVEVQAAAKRQAAGEGIDFVQLLLESAPTG